MGFKVIVTSDAEADLDRFIQYLLIEKKNRQAALNLLDDFEKTILNLSEVAGSLKYCDNPRLMELGYKRINFQSHRYFMLFRIEKKCAIVDNIFHELQDYENRLQ